MEIGKVSGDQCGPALLARSLPLAKGQLPLLTGADQVVIEEEQPAEELAGRRIGPLGHRLPEVTECGAQIAGRQRRLRRSDQLAPIHGDQGKTVTCQRQEAGRARAGACDACAMTTRRILYEGPASLAVPTATMLADAEGIELTSSDMGERSQTGGDVVRLALVVEGSPEAITAAVVATRDGLPPGATVTIDEPTA